jgi:hypothetical protein
MATPEAQRKWRDKNRFIKKQLNVMTRKGIHEYLEGFAEKFKLRGKGEAVTFASVLTQALIQRAEYNEEAARILEDISQAYHRDRELYSA